MPMPVRSLPVAQNWDCAGCAACCRSYHVPVTPEERARIEGQGWANEPELKDTAFFVKEGSWLGGTEYRLNHRPDGACVFLGPDNRCRIHAKFGSAAKPLACRVYPFLLVPAGDHWRVGLRFACPSAAEDHGRPLADHLSEVREYAAALEADSPGAVNAPPTPLQPGQLVPWADLLRIAAAISKLLGGNDGETPPPPADLRSATSPTRGEVKKGRGHSSDLPPGGGGRNREAVSGGGALPHDSLERRWRKVLGLVGLCRGLRFDGGGDAKKMVTGGRLSEMLHVLSEAADEETPRSPDEVPRPGWAGRVVFRQVAAVYTRKDHGAEKGTAQRGPVGRVLAAMSFARGRGRIPKVNALIAEATFAAAEMPAGPLSKEADAMLTRYYRMKVESLQFCGPTNFNMPFWDGLESLAMAFPAVMWLSRVLAAGGLPRDEAITRALRVVDDNYGFNRLLGLGRQKIALKLLAQRGELPRLVAWYGR